MTTTRIRPVPVHLMSTTPTTGTVNALKAACGATVTPALRWMATSHVWAATCPACVTAAKEGAR